MYVQEEVETSRLRRILRTRFSYPGFLPEFLIQKYFFKYFLILAAASAAGRHLRTKRSCAPSSSLAHRWIMLDSLPAAKIPAQ